MNCSPGGTTVCAHAGLAIPPNTTVDLGVLNRPVKIAASSSQDVELCMQLFEPEQVGFKTRNAFKKAAPEGAIVFGKR